MDYKVSTQTFIVYTNIGDVDLKYVYNTTNVDEDIIGIKYITNVKGFYFSPSSLVTSSNVATTTRNLRCLTLRILAANTEPRMRKKNEPKTICVKIFKNGTIQLTGCKIESHVYTCLSITFKVLKINCVEFYLQSVMFNISFNISYCQIDKEKLSQYLYEKEKINVPSLINDSIGLKFKIPYNFPIYIQKYKWTPGNKFFLIESISYKDFFATDLKKLRRTFNTSVTVFINGKIAMSGINKDVIEYSINWIKSVLETAKNDIVIKPKIIKTFRRGEITPHVV